MTDAYSPGLQCLAAKLNAAGDRWLPLWVHSTDTCGVACRLLNRWLPEYALRAMSGGLAAEELEGAVRAAAVLHDIGKATALFQTGITADCPILRERLSDAGFSFLSDQDMKLLKGRNFPHAAAGEALLIMEGVPRSFAEITGAHHGRPWAEGAALEDELRESIPWPDVRSKALWGSREQREIWRRNQKAFLKQALAETGYPAPDSLPEIPQTTAVLLTGLVIMADWIASNEEYFPLIPLEQTDPGSVSERLEKGWKAIALPAPWLPVEAEDLSNLSRTQFGFEPNSVQKAMMEAVQHSGDPGLMILEAPMGAGKTEAALLTANLLARKGAGGIFFGLPTQATANAVFDRFVDWRENQPESNQHSIRLAHGMADLNERYLSLTAGNRESSVEEDGEQAEKLLVHEWFRGRKQALLADFVIGTVDQVLMAALRQKHIMLRHLGLSGKTVIIDECHAYDAYMNQYLETALRWLGSYRTPVVLLSATLPAERRGAFVAAYLNRPGTSRERGRLMNEPWYRSSSYPVLTWTDGKTVRQQCLTHSGPTRKVRLTRIEHGDSLESQAEAAAAILTGALKDGGCAAVILNTVRRAQFFSEAIKAAIPDAEVLLLHSRFVMSDRLRHEADLLKRMGRKSGKKDRDRVIVIGTQVIEQSLDFDADIMISDLCPMDLLLQRMGRLHRHGAHDGIRPAGLRLPQCCVLCAGEKTDSGAKAVYGEYLLMRTRELLPETVELPESISRLVNEVYDDGFILSEEPEGYEQAKAKAENQKDELRRGAAAFCIHGPGGDYSELLEGSIPSDEEHARAQVRAGERLMDALLLTRTEDGALSPMPWIGKGEAWRTDQCPPPEDCREILAQRISLTAGLLNALLRDTEWESILKTLALPEAWESSPWLKGSRLLVLDSRFRVSIGGIELCYSGETGLKWNRKGDEHEQ